MFFQPSTFNAQLLQQHFETLAETPEAVVKSELILYQTEDNRTRIEVRLENETVWLTQAQILQQPISRRWS